MPGKEDSKRRINLTFDDLEQDILEWLNTFGKIKRAKIAKAAIRKAMIEGQTANSLLNTVAAQGNFFNSVRRAVSGVTLIGESVRDEFETKGNKQTFQEEIEVLLDEDLKDLLGLTGSEECKEILNLI